MLKRLYVFRLADTHGSYIPLNVRNVSASLYNSESSKLVATGSWGKWSIHT